MAASNFLARIIEAIQNSLDAHGMGEDGLTFGASLTILPGANGQPTPVIVVVVSARSPLLGQPLNGTATIADFNVSEEAIDRMIVEMLSNLHATRSEILAQSNGHGPAPTGGLQLPPGVR